MDFSSIAYISRVSLSRNDSEKNRTGKAYVVTYLIPLHGQRATRDNKADLFGFSKQCSNLFLLQAASLTSDRYFPA